MGHLPLDPFRAVADMPSPASHSTGMSRIRWTGLLLAGLLAAAIVAAAFAPQAAAQSPLTPTPAPTSPPELESVTEVVGWGIVIAFSWLIYPAVGLLLYIAALAFGTGDRGIIAQSSAIVLLIFSPVYTLIKSGLGGKRK